jgi:hypothetical protein
VPRVRPDKESHKLVKSTIFEERSDEICRSDAGAIWPDEAKLDQVYDVGYNGMNEDGKDEE